MTRSYSDRQRALKWVLLVTVPRTVLDATATLRGPLPTPDGTASFWKAILPTDCVLLVRQLVNELRSSCAQTSCKECAALRQDARSALRSAGRKGSTRE